MSDPERPPAEPESAASWSWQSPLGAGKVVLRASAGTGKTYTVTSLVLRLLCERGLRMGEILVVTFTEKATAELRERIRTRLIRARRQLESDRAPDPEREADDHAFWTLAEQRGVRRRWAAILAEARESFDDALISTIHGFCRRMLREHALACGVDIARELITDTGEALEEVVDDVMARTLHDVSPREWEILHDAAYSRDRLLDLARVVCPQPDLELVPAHGRAELEARARQARARLREALVLGLPQHLVRAAELERRAGRLRSQGKDSLAFSPRAVERAERELRRWLGATESRHDPSAELPRCVREKPFHHGVVAALTVDPEDPPRLGAEVDALLEACADLRRCRQERTSAIRVEAARALRVAWRARLERRREQIFEDLLRELANPLSTPSPARDALQRAIAERFRAALIDEFQDTDGRQWTIFRELFVDNPRQPPGGPPLVVLIGDDKQAIYGFRGANIRVYEAAISGDARVLELARNWRTDPRLIDSLNRLYGRHGDPFAGRIRYVQVEAAREDRLFFQGSDRRAPALDLRVFDAALAGAQDTSRPLTRARARDTIPALVADDIVQLLDPADESKALELAGGPDGARRTRLRPSHVAVLVRRGKEAAAVRRALQQRGVPAVMDGGESVLKSDEALELLRWLRALARPRSEPLARAVAAGPLVGWTAAELCDLERDEPAAVERRDRLIEHLGEVRPALESRGVMHALRLTLREHHSEQILLGRADGERRLTNLRHLAELLHVAEREHHLGLRGLIAWLGREMTRPGLDAETTELRLETDDEAVRVMTMHAAKGLEFPVTFVPFAWDDVHLFRFDTLVAAPEPDSAHRIVDLHSDPKASPKRERVVDAWMKERQESLRLLYVALTRARHRCVLYTGHVEGLELSALGWLLHAADGPSDPSRPPPAIVQALGKRPLGGIMKSVVSALPGLDGFAGQAAKILGFGGSGAVRAELSGLVAELNDGAPADEPRAAMSPCSPPRRRRYRRRRQGPEEDPRPAEAPAALRDGWIRTSYSALARSLDHGPEVRALSASVGIEEEGPGLDAGESVGAAAERDEASGTPGAASGASSVAPEVPLAMAPRGTEAGSWFHELFEHFDFTAAERPEAEAAIARLAERRLRGFASLRGRLEPDFPTHFRQVFLTPLGDELGELRLADLGRADRLDEMRFDLPVLGGRGARTSLPPERLLAALRTGLRDDSELGVWLAGIGAEAIRAFSGFIAGYIDLTFRVDRGGRARWYVCDYKSNALLDGAGRSTPEAYDRAGMAAAMDEHHYYLQACLYSVAAHRFLRSRIPDYVLERDFGGAWYLFFRGMLGPDTAHDGRGRRRGCFLLQPPPQLVLALDAALDGRAPPEPGPAPERPGESEPAPAPQRPAEPERPGEQAKLFDFDGEES